MRVLRTVGHDGVDDGWWEGELDGRTGLFPSLVVEDCHANGDPLTPEVSCQPTSARGLYIVTRVPLSRLEETVTNVYLWEKGEVQPQI